MAQLVIDHEKCIQCELCVAQCPFSAMSIVNGKVETNAACKMCRICVKNCPVGAITIEEEKTVEIDKSLWQDILVYVEHDNESIHPVSYELIGKALELAKPVNMKVAALMAGKNIKELAQDLLYSGVDCVYLYEDDSLETFRVDSFANVFEDCINKMKPSVCLVGATTTGRSLAPRVAVRVQTGLTADCTSLEIRENTDLVQIRPAFGGNIMAKIINTKCRPQFATVRYKVMNAPEMLKEKQGRIIECEVTDEMKLSGIEILKVEKKAKVSSIEEAEILVVAGSAIKDEKGMDMIREFASLLNASVAVTRPMVEKGLGHVNQQIGLSGRTVKPKLIITCGVSGAIQFTAGMKNSEMIVAINSDPNAPIFELAHYAVVDDIYALLPKLMKAIKEGQA
ncbi:MAG: electron transfer flavoprotein subunit alpha [Erysipelotrichaceae bacterium]|nr:electron transfer flavoprotein subunit alpha [Erysipelotrichaceae bacterium]